MVQKLVDLVGGTNYVPESRESRDDSSASLPPSTNGHAAPRYFMPRTKPASRRMAAPAIPLPAAPAVTRNGIIQWDEEKMTTGDESIDGQHQELIRRINELQEACLAGTAKEEIMELLGFGQVRHVSFQP